MNVDKLDYIVVCPKYGEVIVYNSKFNDALNNAIYSAKQIQDSWILRRTVFQNGTKTEEEVWNNYD